MNREISVQKECNKEKILTFLEKDRIWAGYGICDLEQQLFALSEWYAAYSDRQITALSLYFVGFEIPTHSTFGSILGIGKILEKIKIPQCEYAHFLPTHKEFLTKYYNFDNLRLLKRMFIAKRFFTPSVGTASRLTDEDLIQLERLYAERAKTYFLPYMLTSGVYYGIRENGKLVSVAGTHACSPLYQIACIGNVFTHPTHRGRGYATICTSKVVEELLRNHKDVILNVESENLSAIRVYKKLGFREHCTYYNGFGTLKR